MNFRHKLIVVSLLSTLLCSASYSSNTIDLEKINQQREINMVLKQRKQKSTTATNNTSEAATLSVLYCYHPADLIEGSAIIHIPQSGFTPVSIGPLDDTLFPKTFNERKDLSRVWRGKPSESTVVWNEKQQKYMPITTGLWLKREYIIAPNKNIPLYSHTEAYLSAIQLTSGSGFLSLVTDKQNFSFTINPSFSPSFPPPLNASKLLNEDKLADPLAQYAYNTVSVNEGYTPEDCIKKIQNMHDTNSPLIANTSFSDLPSIPLMVHTLWLSNDEFSDQRVHWLATSMNSCNAENGWQHILWVLNRTTEIEAIKNRLRDFGLKTETNVEIKEFSELNSSYQTQISNLAEQRDFSSASHIASFEILNKFGGVVRSTGLEILHNLAHYNRSFDLYLGLDQVTTYLPATELMASIPGHPIIQKTLELIQRNLNTLSCPSYLTEIPSDINASDALSGSVILGTAIMNTTSTLRDIVLPARIFCSILKADSKGEAPTSYADAHVTLCPDVMAVNHSTRYGGTH